MVFYRLMLVLIMAVVAVPGFAESRRDAGAGSDPVRKAQLMMRQLSQAKARLEAENAKLASEVKLLQTRNDTLETDLQKINKGLDKSKASNNRLVGRIKDDHRKMQTLMEKYRDTVQLLRMEKANVAHLKLAVDERNQWIGKCKTDNERLYEVSNELVDRYQNKGFLQELTQADPLTGIGDVRMEVIAEDYRYKIDDLQVSNFEGRTNPPKN